MSSNVRRRRRTIEERLGAAVRHLRPGDLAGRGEPLPRDRGATRVSGGGPDEGGARGSHIEHVTLEAAASQTIASGGAGVSWGQIVGPPTERAGFETLSARIAADGSVVAIPVDVTGVLNATIVGLYATYRAGGTVTVTLDRLGSERHITLLDEVVTSRRFVILLDNIEVQAGDTLTVTLPNGSGTDTTLTSATAQLKVITLATATTPDNDPYRALILSQGPVAYWRLGESSVSAAAVDETGNGHDGTYSADVDLRRDPLINLTRNTAAYFGAFEHMEAPDDAALELTGTSAWSVSAWINRESDGTSTDRYVFCKRRASNVEGLGLYTTENTGTGLFSVEAVRNNSSGSDVAAGAADLAMGGRHHLAATYDGATLRVYVDGSEVDSVASSRSLSDQPYGWRVGRNAGDGFPGVIDEPAIWDRALTAAEVAEQYQVGTS